MSDHWMTPDEPGPTALCVTNPDAKAAHEEAAYGNQRGHHRVRLYDVAKEWCEECPVRQACLEYALASEMGPTIWRAGIFGGMTPSERATAAGFGRKDDPDTTRRRNREQRRKRRQAQAVALTIACPTCRQPVDSRCISNQGNVTEPHLARVTSAEVAA